jgi:predicted PurR-regulated permease PerM
MGRTLDLSPLLVLLSLVFWGWLWGLWGMVLAVPITSIIKIVCENVEALQPVAVLMSAGAARKRAPQNKNEFSGNV